MSNSRALTAMGMALALAACGGIASGGGGGGGSPDGGGGSQKPAISSFTASPTTVAPGSASTLSWAVSGATSLSIDQGVGTVTGTSKSVSPTTTTTYTLTAGNGAGSATAKATVTVAAVPSILSFTSSPSVVAPGGSSTLSWTVSGATALSIDQGVGAVTGTSKSVSPGSTTTYTLSAGNAYGTTTAKTTVTVSAGGGADVTVAVDTGSNVRAISPFVYGYNGATAAESPPGTTWLRLGGNRWTAYNWETNYSNAGSDYLYENDTYMGSPSDGPGHAAVPSVADAKANGLGLCVTIPIQGWVAKDASGPVSLTSTLTDHFLQTVAKKGAPFSNPPVTTDAYVYQDELAWFLSTQWSGAALPLHLMLDNEPDLWSATHAEIQRAQLTYAALLSQSIASAGAIKDAVPSALVFGPVSYGWAGYVNLQGAPDSAQLGDFLNYYLSQMSQASATQGRRLLDVLDLHFYSEATGCGTRVTVDNNSDCVVAARVQAPRSLWDPTYVETSWITQDSTNNSAIALIPRMLGKIAANYPGTLLSVSEYDHGGGDHISGAVAQADTLGIFGREGMYAGSYWPLLSNNAWGAGAWLCYRNYDGAGTSFGDTSVSAGTSDIAHVSAFASVDQASPDRVVVVLVHRPTLNGSSLDLSSRTVSVQVTHGKALTKARSWQLTSGSPVQNGVATPQRLPDATVAGNQITLTLPALSVTTLELTP